jgi:hypothetical protein
MPSRRSGYLVLLAIALLLLVQGRLAASGGPISWQTIGWDMLGLGLFIWLADTVASSPGFMVGEGSSNRLLRVVGWAVLGHPGRTGLLLASLVAQCAALTVNASAAGNSPDQWLSFLYWLLSVGLFLAACWPSGKPLLGRTRWREWFARNGLDLACLLVLASLGFALRAVSRETIPYPLTGDEASVGMNGLAIIRGAVTNMFGTGWSSQPNLSFLLPGILQAFFGADIGGLRLFSALMGTLSIPLLYLLALERWGRKIAILSAAYLTAYHYHIHFSRIAVNNVADGTLWLLAFYLLWRGVRTGLAVDWAAAGAAAGLGIYSYAGGRLGIVLMAIVVAFMLLQEPERLADCLRANALRLLALLGGMLVTILPMAIYFSHHMNEFGARMNQVGIWQTGWLQNELRNPGQTVPTILADRVWRTVFVFTNVPATSGFYNSTEPLLGSVASILFVLGLAWSLWHWRNPAYFMVNVWFLAVAGGAALTVDLPNAARTSATAPIVALLVVVGLVQVIETARSFVRISPRAQSIATGLAVAALCAGSLKFYFLEYIPGNYFGDANSELGMEAGYYLKSLGSDYKAYFFGLPRIFFNFPTIEYLRGNVTGIDGPATLPRDLSFVSRDRGAVFIFIPERANEVQRLQQGLPGGKVLMFPRKTKSETLFVAYELPPPR